MGWKQYLGLEYVDYTDQIFQSFIKTRYAKRQVSLVMSLAISWVVRWHLKILLTFFIDVHPLVDFTIHVFVSVLLVFKSVWIQNLVSRFQVEIYALSRYLINNYTQERFRIWKRNAVVSICIYFLLYLTFVEVNSWMLIEQILQFLISYFIVDGIEQGTFLRWWTRLRSFYKDNIRSNGSKLSNKTVFIRDGYLDESSSSYEEMSEEEEEILQKSWMGLDNIFVVEDSRDHSVVVFQNEE